MILEIDDVVGRLQLALKGAIGADVPVLCGYAAAKARAVVRYADLIADAYARGLLDDEEMAREMQDIAQMTRRFTASMRGHAPAMQTRAAEAATQVIHGAMRGALGFAGSPLSEETAPQAA